MALSADSLIWNCCKKQNAKCNSYFQRLRKKNKGNPYKQRGYCKHRFILVKSLTIIFKKSMFDLVNIYIILIRS